MNILYFKLSYIILLSNYILATYNIQPSCENIIHLRVKINNHKRDIIYGVKLHPYNGYDIHDMMYHLEHRLLCDAS